MPQGITTTKPLYHLVGEIDVMVQEVQAWTVQKQGMPGGSEAEQYAQYLIDGHYIAIRHNLQQLKWYLGGGK